MLSSARALMTGESHSDSVSITQQGFGSGTGTGVSLLDETFVLGQTSEDDFSFNLTDLSEQPDDLNDTCDISPAESQLLVPEPLDSVQEDLFAFIKKEAVRSPADSQLLLDRPFDLPAQQHTKAQEELFIPRQKRVAAAEDAQPLHCKRAKPNYFLAECIVKMAELTTDTMALIDAPTGAVLWCNKAFHKLIHVDALSGGTCTVRHLSQQFVYPLHANSEPVFKEALGLRSTTQNQGNVVLWTMHQACQPQSPQAAPMAACQPQSPHLTLNSKYCEQSFGTYLRSDPRSIRSVPLW